jgi:hypothetical protein
METMMSMRIDRTLLWAAVLAATSLPAAANARGDEALDQCVQAFVNEVVPPGHSVQIRHDDIRASTIRSATRSRLNVIARGAKYGELFGRATCVMDRSGSLVATYVYGPRVGLTGNGRPKVITGNG